MATIWQKASHEEALQKDEQNKCFCKELINEKLGLSENCILVILGIVFIFRALYLKFVRIQP